jgi:hypothetical protein
MQKGVVYEDSRTYIGAKGKHGNLHVDAVVMMPHTNHSDVKKGVKQAGKGVKKAGKQAKRFGKHVRKLKF